MLQKINTYIFGQILRALGFSLLALVGMFWIGKTIPLIDLVILRGESASTFFRLSTYLLPSIIKVLLPIATLIAVIFTLNRMANDGELMSIHNSGRSPMWLLLPITQVGILLWMISTIISLWMVPASLYGLRTNLELISENYSKNIITAQKFINPNENLFIYVEDSLLSGEMLNIFIDDRRGEQSTRNYFANRAYLVKQDNRSKLALIDGKYHERSLETGQISVGHFDRLEIEMQLGEASFAVSPDTVEERTLTQLFQVLAIKGSYAISLAELVDRIIFPMLSFILGIIGVLGFLLSAYSRHGYKRAIIFGTIAGLLMEAFVFSLRGIITNDSSLVWLAALPFLITIIAIILVGRVIKGQKL